MNLLVAQRVLEAKQQTLEKIVHPIKFLLRDRTGREKTTDLCTKATGLGPTALKIKGLGQENAKPE